MRRKIVRGLVITAALATAAVAIGAETAKVQRPTVDVLDDKGSGGEAVETLAQGAAVEVLGHDGKWLHVRTASGKEGYIPEAVVAKSGGGIDLSGLTGGSDASAANTAAAGRGWTSDVETYADAKHYSRDGLKRMEALRKACVGKPLKEFKREGDLGGKH